jgi:acetyl esterase
MTKSLMRRIGCLLGGCLAVAPLLAEAVSGTFLQDIEYGRAGGEVLLLDAAVPAGEGPYPAVILVHGGGWTGGSKAGDTAALIEPLAQAGFVCLAINYRLAPQHHWPACRDDVLTAIRWAKAHAVEFKGDPARIALIGYSAGGHLVCSAATVVDDSVRVQAVVGLAPLTDFVQELPKRGNILGSAQRGLLDRPQELTPESVGLLRAISPVNHLRPGLPPFLLIHGDADGSVPYVQSATFQARLRELGVDCDLITLPGAPHRLSEWERYLPGQQDRMIDWLREVLVVPAGAKVGSHALNAPPPWHEHADDLSS